MDSNRRKFLKTLTASSAVLALNPRAALLGSATTEIEKHPTPGSLDFVFFTDTHIQPELDAAHGCALAFQKIATQKPERQPNARSTTPSAITTSSASWPKAAFSPPTRSTPKKCLKTASAPAPTLPSTARATTSSFSIPFFPPRTASGKAASTTY